METPEQVVGYEKYDLAAVNDMMERDRYMTAEEAKDNGIVDEILHKREKEDGKPGDAAAKAP